MKLFLRSQHLKNLQLEGIDQGLLFNLLLGVKCGLLLEDSFVCCRAFLLPPGWDAGPSRGPPPPPQHELAVTHNPFIHLGEERHYEG